MMFRLMLWTLLLTFHILSCVSTLKLPSPQLNEVSCIFLRYAETEKGIKQDEFVVTWNSKQQVGSFFNTKNGNTSAVFYSLTDEQKYVMKNWPNGKCETKNPSDETKFLTERILSSGKKFNLIQLLSGDQSLSIKSCELKLKHDNCMSTFVCKFVDSHTGTSTVLINTCTRKVWQAAVTHDVSGKTKTTTYTILDNIENWNDRDWLQTPTYGDKMSMIDMYTTTPSGTYCKGRRSSKYKNVPRLPQYFSMYVDEVHVYEPEMRKMSYKVFDFKNRLVREDFVPDPKHSPELYRKFGGSVMLRIVEDFQTGSRFVIDSRRGNCSIIPLGIGLFTIATQHSHVRMRYSYELFDFNTKNCWQYSGRVHIRGYPAYRFICQMKHGSYPDVKNAAIDTREVYYRASSKDKSATLKQDPVLVLMRHIHTPIDKSLKHEFSDYTWHVVNFRTDHTDHSLDTFDITSCYNRIATDRVDFFAIIHGNYNELMKEPEIYSKIRQALASPSRVPPHRITRIRLDTQADPEYVILWFTLLGHPSAPQQNMHYMMQDRVSLKEARSYLENMVNRNMVSISGQHHQHFRVMPNSLHTVQKRESLLSVEQAKQEQQASHHYNAGDMAALGLSCLGIGALGSAMALLCVQRRRRQAAVAYYVKT